MKALEGELDESESWDKSVAYLDAHRRQLAEAFCVPPPAKAKASTRAASPVRRKRGS